ncbi:hypothetical protein [Streptomyces zagrosensis]|uniref:Type VI protein secretion system component VasF n=1 Tax=Streptomyces zagrosensis TaxID=1042984 RepID=A0A7W9UWF3_9ACTN|nr:hypothetical protein [Streptomyces zagrosensis]MBB5933723.1 type VI protein secretion system component VasF [Streptomyces zagrosensis]
MPAPAYSHAGRPDRTRASGTRVASGAGLRSAGVHRDGVEVQLPWWAIALPAVVFAALLLLLFSPSDAHAAQSGTGHIAQFFTWVRDSIVQLLS